MKIYNEEKTQELNRDELDCALGHLESEKLFIAHHAATPFVKGKTAQERYEAITAAGEVATRIIGGKFYTVDRAFENGVEINPLSVEEWIAGVHSSSVTEIVDEPDIPAKEAWDDFEDIQVYIPYTAEELEERRLTALRSRRTPLLEAFDKWEKAVLRGRESDDIAVMEWYERMLDLDELAFENIPKRIQYYIG